MHALSFGGYIIDTPGVRGFGLINIEREELSHRITSYNVCYTKLLRRASTSIFLFA